MILVKYKRKEVKEIEDPQLEALIRAAWEARQDLRQKQRVVKDAQEVIIKRAHEEGLTATGTFTLQSGRARVKVRNFREVVIKDPLKLQAIKEILGEEMEQYVKIETKVEVKPTKKMLEVLSDGDSELGKQLREYVDIVLKTQVEWP